MSIAKCLALKKEKLGEEVDCYVGMYVSMYVQISKYVRMFNAKCKVQSSQCDLVEITRLVS